MKFEPIDIKVRCEADLYGYSLWLATYLGLDSIPLSHRGFQHGWYWYDFEIVKNVFLARGAPTAGILVQDDNYAAGYNHIGIFAITAGLPFINFLEYSGFKQTCSESARSGTLLVPTHSHVEGDYSDYVLNQIIWAAERNENVSVMLGASDLHLYKDIKKYCNNVEIGARNNDASSFFRIAEIFSRYENMLTTQMGSHVLYGTQCNLNVHLLENNEIIPKEFRGEDKYFYERRNVDTSKFMQVSTHEFVKEIYPELYDGRGSLSGKISSQATTLPPATIADLLGWKY